MLRAIWSLLLMHERGKEAGSAHLVGVLLDVLDSLQDAQCLVHITAKRQVVDGGVLDDALHGSSQMLSYCLLHCQGSLNQEISIGSRIISFRTQRLGLRLQPAPQELEADAHHCQSGQLASHTHALSLTGDYYSCRTNKPKRVWHSCILRGCR